MVTGNMPGPALPAWVGEDYACDRCGLDYPRVTVDDVVRAIQVLPEQLRTAVDAVAPLARRQRPAPFSWSVAEYACHVRYVLVSSTIRLHRGRTESAPAVDPMFNDLRAELFAYNQADLSAVLAEVTAVAAGLRAEISRMTEADWNRVVLRQPGEQRTTRWLARQALHEGVHHLADIAAAGASVS